MNDVKRYDCTSGSAQFCYGCYTMTEDKLGDYVLFEDYDRLRALCARQRAWHDAVIRTPPEAVNLQTGDVLIIRPQPLAKE